jgi:hypothetical protein
VAGKAVTSSPHGPQDASAAVGAHFVPAVQSPGGKPAPYTPAPYKAEADETVTCPSCGKQNDSDASYCDQCGRRL